MRAASSRSGTPVSDPSRLKEAKEALTASARFWAACLSRIFEVDPHICPNCAVRMAPVAVILDDRALVRLLARPGLPIDLPKTLPTGSNHARDGPDSQVDSREDDCLGIDPLPADELQPA